MNIRRTLMETGIGAHQAITLTGVKGTTLRNTASSLKERGYCFHVMKIENGYRVWRTK